MLASLIKFSVFNSFSSTFSNFVLLCTLRYEIHKDARSVEERLGKTFETAGVSIGITSFTDFIAFMLGFTVRLDAVQAFCFFAGVTFFSNFLV